MKRAALVLLLVAGLLAILTWRGCHARTIEISSPPSKTATPVDEPRATASVVPLTPSNEAVASRAAAIETSAYRLRALTFAIDASGVRLERTLTAAGRVKAPPRSIASWRLEFEVLGRNDEKLYEGAIDHPLHRTLEFEDPVQRGVLRRSTQEIAQESFLLRLPEPMEAARIVFFEVQPTRTGPLRTLVSTVSLP